MVEGMIREFIGRPQLGLTTTSFTETKSGDGSTWMRLKHTPIVAVSQILVSDVAVDADNIYVGEYYVQLKNNLSFTRGVRNVDITYTAGSGDVTADIRLAAATMIVAINNFYGRQGSDSSLKWSTMTDSKDKGGEPSPDKNLGLASHLDGIMKSMIKKKTLKIA